MGASRLDRAEPHSSTPGKENYFIARYTLRWGSAWDCKGSAYVEAQHRAANGQPKVNGGHATGACLLSPTGSSLG
jgi:hypothetical protein